MGQPILARLGVYGQNAVTGADKRTAAVFVGRCPKGFPSDLLAITRRKIKMLDAAISLMTYVYRRVTGWSNWWAIASVSIPSR